MSSDDTICSARRNGRRSSAHNKRPVAHSVVQPAGTKKIKGMRYIKCPSLEGPGTKATGSTVKGDVVDPNAMREDVHGIP